MTEFETMIEGYRRFRQTGWDRERERWAKLATSQEPKVMVIACSDSRVDPATIFDTVPGEIFVVRNVANIVPPFEDVGGLHGVSAAIEFAVNNLEVRKIVVMGHGGCGGVAAALARRFEGCARGEGGFLDSWTELLAETRDRVLAEHGPNATSVLEREGIKMSLANLRTFPCVARREASGDLALQGALFAIDDGVLHALNEQTGQFEAVA